MSRIDENGVRHPSGSDLIDERVRIHMAYCLECNPYALHIPEAAVEAAARASAAVFGEAPNKRDLEHVRKVLEAAAPHMLAEIKSGIDAELQDAPIANYEENNYEAGYVAGLAFALETMQAIK